MENTHDATYLRLLNEVMLRGVPSKDRTGVGTRSIFGAQMRFGLSDTFPLLTSKRVYWKGVVHELLWFLKGDTNIGYLKDNGVSIWDEWADDSGDLGPIYGHQWRSWPVRATYVNDTGERLMHSEESIDQIDRAVQLLRANPDSRRIIVSAWNPADLGDMALPPCHAFFQFNSRKNTHGRRVLDCQLYQRSADMFLGVPFNIASYSLLTLMMAKVTDHLPGEFIWSGGDVHVYENHIEQVREQLGRWHGTPKSPRVLLPRNIEEIDDFRFEDIMLLDYEPLPAIKAPVAV
jgi:thymidylate synthase